VVLLQTNSKFRTPGPVAKNQMLYASYTVVALSGVTRGLSEGGKLCWRGSL